MITVITGASGYLGRRVAEIMITEHGVAPADLVLVTRSPDKLANLAADGARVRHGDFDDPASLQTAFAGAEKVLIVSTDRVGARVQGTGIRRGYSAPVSDTVLRLTGRGPKPAREVLAASIAVRD